jgi:hypothetical protein
MNILHFLLYKHLSLKNPYLLDLRALSYGELHVYDIGFCSKVSSCELAADMAGHNYVGIGVIYYIRTVNLH